MGTVGNKLEYLEETKQLIKDAIINKGQPVNDTDPFRSYAGKIDAITTGGNYQEKTVTPAQSAQTVVADEGYNALSKVTVEGDSNLVAENIKSGVEIFGVVGTSAGAGNLQEKVVMPVAEGVTIFPDEGYDGLSRVGVFGDLNLAPENIKSGVSIFGVEGALESGSGMSVDGSQVTIEARDGFAKGDRFVAIANENGVPPTAEETALGVTGFISISEDQSVAVFPVSITTTTSSIPLAIRDDETGEYTHVNITLPSLATVTGNNGFNANNCQVNEDGTLVVISDIQDSSFGTGTNSYGGTIVIEVDKKNKSGVARYCVGFGEVSESDAQNIWVSTYDNSQYPFVGFRRTSAPKTEYDTCMVLTKQYLFKKIGIGCYYNNNNETTSGYVPTRALLYYNKQTHNFEIICCNKWNSNYGPKLRTVAWADNNTLIFMVAYLNSNGGMGGIFKAKLNGSNLLSFTQGQGPAMHSISSISSNGKYLVALESSNASYASIYSYNTNDMQTYKGICTVTNGRYIDETGTYVLRSDNVVSDISAGSQVTLNQLSGGLTSRYFNIVTGECVRGNYKVQITPSTNAQYLANSCNGSIDTSKSGKVYGVMADDVQVGEKGTGYILFRT